MGSGDFKNIIMQYLTIRWVTLSNLSEKNFKLFQSLERALNKSIYLKLCCYKQTENYLKQQFNLLVNQKNISLSKLKKFDINLQNFLKQNHIKEEILLNNIDFLEKCDEIIYHKANCRKNTSDKITSLP